MLKGTLATAFAGCNEAADRHGPLHLRQGVLRPVLPRACGIRYWLSGLVSDGHQHAVTAALSLATSKRMTTSQGQGAQGSMMSTTYILTCPTFGTGDAKTYERTSMLSGILSGKSLSVHTGSA